MIEGQRQRTGGGRRRRRKTKAEAKAKAQPDLIVARRPGSPLLMKVKNRNIAASAKPKKAKGVGPGDDATSSALNSARSASNGAGEKVRRTARIVQLPASAPDDDELRRQRLLDRLVCSEGRSAISRIADELIQNQLEVPEEQEVQLQLLEHVDERRARAAIDVMTRLLQHQPPIKRPILDQRLRRLELEADEQETRDKAAALRRSIRVA